MGRRSPLTPIAVAAFAGAYFCHHWGWLVVIGAGFVALLTRNRCFIYLLIGVLCSSWAAFQLRVTDSPTHATRSGCFRVLQWPSVNNFGATEVVIRVGKLRYHVSDQRLGKEHISLFDSVCATVSMNSLPSRNRNFYIYQHIVGDAKVITAPVIKHASFPVSFVGSLRTTWFDGVQRMSPHNAALLQGIVLGYTGGQSAQDKQIFRNSGLVHIMAVSGENVAFVLIVIIGSSPPRSFARLFPALFTLLLFALVTGMQPSVLRAECMASFALMTGVIGINTSRASGLLTAIVFLVAIDPLIVHQVGFELSVGATIGIVYLMPLIHNWLPPSRFANALAISMSAQLGTVIPMAMALHKLAPVSSFLYIIIEPIVALLMIVGVSFGLLAGLVGPVGTLYSFVCSLGTACVYAVARWGASLPPLIQYGGWLIPSVLLASRIAKSKVNDGSVCG